MKDEQLEELRTAIIGSTITEIDRGCGDEGVKLTFELNGRHTLDIGYNEGMTRLDRIPLDEEHEDARDNLQDTKH